MNGEYIRTTVVIFAVVLVQLCLLTTMGNLEVSGKSIVISFIGIFVWLMGITIFLDYILQKIIELKERPIGIIEVRPAEEDGTPQTFQITEGEEEDRNADN